MKRNASFVNKRFELKGNWKWLPYNLNYGPHDCIKKQDTTKVNGATKKIEEQNQRTTLTVAEVVNRLK
jgi:hypothetical protein